MNRFRRALHTLRSTIAQPVPGLDQDRSSWVRDYPLTAPNARR